MKNAAKAKKATLIETFVTNINGFEQTVTVQELVLQPITAEIRAQWLKKDLLRHFGTADEEAALDKFIARRGGHNDLKGGRDGAREMMHSYVRQF